MYRIYKMQLNRFWFLVLILSLSYSAQGQSKKERLEAKRLELQRQISQINNQLNEVNHTRANALEILNQINKKISIRNQLIKSLRGEINVITQKINRTDTKIGSLEKEIGELKNNYAEMIRQSYKNRSRNGKIYFLLSSEDFQQAFKRMQYLKQYANFRKNQVKEIQKKQAELRQLIKQLETSKEEKQKLFSKYKTEQQKIIKEKKVQQLEIDKIKKRRSYYLTQIKKKERQKRKIDQMIEAEIKKAIVRSNRHNIKSKTYKNSKSKFYMTPEAKKLAGEFSKNRGLLPWPVKKAYISRHYGVQHHEVFKNVKVYNSGVNLATVKGAKVHAVYKGKVLQIQIIPGGNTSVYIKHGNYLSIYQNLKKVMVKPGDMVKTGQTIGIVATDPTTGKTELKFLVYKNLTKLNPENWLLKK